MTGIHQVLAAGSTGIQKFMTELTNNSLTTGLVLCLDAVDSSSYVSGDIWTDVSGAGNNMDLGATVGADSTDPIYTSNRYFTYDGTQYFSDVNGSSTFADNWHKNNATFSVAVCYYRVPGATRSGVCGTVRNYSADAGASVLIEATTHQFALVHNYTDFNRENLISATSLNTNAWNACCVAYDEAGITSRWNTNGTAETIATTASTSTATRDQNFAIGRCGSGPSAGNYAQNGDRISCIAVWSTALTAGNLVTLNTIMTNRLSSL